MPRPSIGSIAERPCRNRAKPDFFKPSKNPLDAFTTSVGILLRMNEMKSIRFLLILCLVAFCSASSHHAVGKDLESPAPATADHWLPEFMQEAKRRNYRVDFICLHWYQDISHPNAVEELQQFLTDQWNRYKKPIWLTEFSGSTGNWINPANPPIDGEKNAFFARKVLPMLESLPFVERYAWFELKWKSKPWEYVTLADPKSGTLTKAGEAYRDGDAHR